MKRSLLLLGLVPVMAFGAVVKNPDANTLCWENAKPVKFDEKGIDGWCVKGGLKATPVPGGLEIDSLGKKGSFEIMLPVSKDYPYIEFDLEILEKGKTFTLMSWMFPKGNAFYWNRDSESGYYVQDLYENAPKMEKKGSCRYQFRIADGKIRVKNLRIVKQPRITLIMKSNFFSGRKYLGEDALLNTTVRSSLKAKGPVQLRFIDSVRRRILRYNFSGDMLLEPVPGKANEYCREEEVLSLSNDDISKGYVMIEIKGFGQKVFTWLCYAWKAPAKFNYDKPLADNLDWIKDLRTDHPRIFINQDTLPKVKAWAEKIGTKQLFADAENFELNPEKTIKTHGYVGEKRPYSTQPVMIANLYEEEALTCALAYLLSGDKKHADKAWTFLDHNLSVYQDCAQKRTAVSWYGIGRIQNMAALDWVWNSDVARAKKYLKEFVNVNIKFVRHGWWGPFYRVNGGRGRTSGFYGDSNNELFMGILAYNEGVCDALAMDMLKEGYKKYRECLNYRDTTSEDDGMLSSSSIGYSSGQYPWASYDFLFLWRAMFKNPVQLPYFTHLMYLSEWFQWNMLPGKGKIKIRDYGYSDHARTTMSLPGIGGHLYTIIGAYCEQYPAASARIADAIVKMDGKYKPDIYKEKKRIYKRKKAPRYYWGFYRKYLAYGMDKIMPAGEKQATEKANARHFRPGGMIFMRSGSDKNATHALFVAGCNVSAHNTRGDENHFTIFKNGYLAIDSGYRCDAWPGSLKYSTSSQAHNTMLIHDPSERFEGDKANCETMMIVNKHIWKDAESQALYKLQRPHYADADGGQCESMGGKCGAFFTGDYYSYALGDATAVYSAKKCREFTRQFVHIQPDVFVVFDRVESTNPTFKKEWLLHFLEEPVVNGNVTTAKVSDEGGILRCTTLLPVNGVITKIGGPGKEFMGTNVNWTIRKKELAKVQYGGKWRINLSPAKASERDYFLNVIDVGANPVKDIRLSEDDNTATVTFTTAQGRKVTATFIKKGTPGGKIRIEENGKVLCDEALRKDIQLQSGFLY